ncbi:hypothetical protein [Ideonella livida]|uniref:DUF962 domain-containing protein n=1 Tax=Ideonella livida TaxID=2707176 RepID=A0A7C9TNV2_9BURK|nr:hypothetical protein [Ideonella livida]NDY93965.1 hypothetical protein [Ideonella livida]
MNAFFQELALQRWDDHRYYHQSRVNQTLHLISALSFLVAYVVLFFDPATAALIGWLVSMVTRQTGHYVFEPRGFDRVNLVTDEYKERVKVGYNMGRKTALLTVWVIVPATLWFQPSLFGLIEPAADFAGFAHDLGIAWLSLGVAGLLARVLQLCLTRSVHTGLVWMTKILTDPFHDVILYHKAPLALLRGEWLDPMEHVREQLAAQGQGEAKTAH